MLDATLFTFSFDLTSIADAGEEMRLSTSIGVKGCKPSVPLVLLRGSFLHVANDRELQTREESVVNNGIVHPAVVSPGDIVAGLLD